ncbi:MAG: efflux RND transporter periplasmic adaptor subunit [Thermodesulfovibrionales bacterium]
MSHRISWGVFVCVLCVLLPFHPANGQEKGNEPPPARVVVADVKGGEVSPTAEFIGTIYYSETSEVSAEVNGKVDQVRFQEGQRVKRGDTLVVLSADLLEKTIESTRASHGQVLADLENARLDFERIDYLYKAESIAGQAYDESRFRVLGLEKKAESLKAELGRLELEHEKKQVRSPFDGVIISKHVERGEWLSPGAKVAKVAADAVVDVIVDVPERIIPFVRAGRPASVEVGGRAHRGKILTVIPEGNVATRTFPVKLRLSNDGTLFEGMEARVMLPSGARKPAFLVPRDALLNVLGKYVIYVVAESRAKMVPVEVVGFEGLTAGIAAEGIQEGMKVVTKGNERLREGQALMVE